MQQEREREREREFYLGQPENIWPLPEKKPEWCKMKILIFTHTHTHTHTQCLGGSVHCLLWVSLEDIERKEI